MLNCKCGIYVINAYMKGLNINKIKSGDHGDRRNERSPLEFRELTLDSLHEVYPFLQSLKGMSCDYTAGGLLMWIDYFKYRYCIYRDTLFIKGVAEDDRRKRAFSMPIGRLPLRESVALLKEYCQEYGYRLEFSAITDMWLDDFKSLGPEEISPLNQWSDYIYDIESLATLKGKKLSKKRNHCNRFMQDNPEAVLEPVLPDNMDMVKECFRQVCIEGKQSPMASYEREQVWKVLEQLERYPFEAQCLKNGDRVVAFTVGEVLNNVLHVHIEKSLRDVAGSAESINRQFAEYIHAKYPEVEWVNRQDDAGDEGLRKAKLSYYPSLLLGKYNVVFG